jgi:hypothetical protein
LAKAAAAVTSALGFKNRRLSVHIGLVSEALVAEPAALLLLGAPGGNPFLPQKLHALVIASLGSLPTASV